MATRSFLESLATRAALVRTKGHPTTRAPASIWSQWFGQAEKEEAEEEDAEEEIDESEETATNPNVRPVAAPGVVQARQDFSRDYWRTAMQSLPISFQLPPLETPQQVQVQPNLQVPVGEEFRFMAQ